MNKRIVAFSVFFASLFLSFAQTEDYSTEDYDAMWEAVLNPIIIKTPNDSCYLEQHFYQDGSLFFEVPVINGKRTGTYKEYYRNGQLYQCYEMIDGHRLDSTLTIVYDRFGNFKSIQILIGFRNKQYACRTDYIRASKSFMFFHEMSRKKRIVAEYICTCKDGKWKKHPYHCKPVRYANRLFRIYRKEWKKRLPDVEF